MTDKITLFKCPTCSAPTQYETEKYPHFPFCCERCKMIDLGAWAAEDHKIEGDETGFDDLFSEDGTL